MGEHEELLKLSKKGKLQNSDFLAIHTGYIASVIQKARDFLFGKVKDGRQVTVGELAKYIYVIPLHLDIYAFCEGKLVAVYPVDKEGATVSYPISEILFLFDDAYTEREGSDMYGWVYGVNNEARKNLKRKLRKYSTFVPFQYRQINLSRGKLSNMGYSSETKDLVSKVSEGFYKTILKIEEKGLSLQFPVTLNNDAERIEELDVIYDLEEGSMREHFSMNVKHSAEGEYIFGANISCQVQEIGLVDFEFDSEGILSFYKREIEKPPVFLENILKDASNKKLDYAATILNIVNASLLPGVEQLKEFKCLQFSEQSNK